MKHDNNGLNGVQGQVNAEPVDSKPVWVSPVLSEFSIPALTEGNGGAGFDFASESTS